MPRMVFRTWSRTLLAALGVAAAAGAGQLGVAYGLGIIHLARGFLDGAEPRPWTVQLAWVAWFAMVAAVLGALAASGTAGRQRLVLGLPGRAAVAVVAGLGAAIVAPLTMQPARAAHIAPAIDPELTVGLTALLGAAAGVVVAAAALSARAVRWNVLAVTVAAWLLALVTVWPAFGPGDPPAAVRLGVLELPAMTPDAVRTLAVLGMPVLALLAGVATAAVARRRGQHVLASASCGAAGAGLLALAYVLAGPGQTAAQTTPYRASLVAVAAGLVGSALVAVTPVPGGPRRGRGVSLRAPHRQRQPRRGLPGTTGAGTRSPAVAGTLSPAVAGSRSPAVAGSRAAADPGPPAAADNRPPAAADTRSSAADTAGPRPSAVSGTQPPPPAPERAAAKPERAAASRTPAAKPEHSAAKSARPRPRPSPRAGRATPGATPATATPASAATTPRAATTPPTATTPLTATSPPAVAAPAPRRPSGGEEIATTDEAYVDWVSGLGDKPKRGRRRT